MLLLKAFDLHVQQHCGCLHCAADTSVACEAYTLSPDYQGYASLQQRSWNLHACPDSDLELNSPCSLQSQSSVVIMPVVILVQQSAAVDLQLERDCKALNIKLQNVWGNEAWLLQINWPSYCQALRENGNLRLMSPFSKDETGHGS